MVGEYKQGSSDKGLKLETSALKLFTIGQLIIPIYLVVNIVVFIREGGGIYGNIWILKT